MTNWNPLGERANQISDLNENETEAVDISFHIDKHHSIIRISNLTKTVLEQAFGLEISQAKSRPYAEQFYRIIREK